MTTLHEPHSGMTISTDHEPTATALVRAGWVDDETVADMAARGTAAEAEIDECHAILDGVGINRHPGEPLAERVAQAATVYNLALPLAAEVRRLRAELKKVTRNAT